MLIKVQPAPSMSNAWWMVPCNRATNRHFGTGDSLWWFAWRSHAASSRRAEMAPPHSHHYEGKTTVNVMTKTPFTIHWILYISIWDTPHFWGSTQTFYVVFVAARQKCGVSLAMNTFLFLQSTYQACTKKFYQKILSGGSRRWYVFNLFSRRIIEKCPC